MRTDGRHLRRQQNRDAVLAAMAELYAEGRYDASAAEIAQRAGLSPRSLFRYFDDVDDLARTAIAHMHEQGRKLLVLAVGPEDPLPERVAAVVDARLRLWEAVGPSARAARLKAPTNEVVAEELARARTYLRRQLAELFAPELARRPAALAPLDVLLSFESYDLLRNDQRLSLKRTAAVLTDAVRALLDDGGKP